jgi:uncharacterized membrane protein
MPEIPPDFRHAMLLWLVTLLCAHELAWVGTRVGSGAGVWTLVPSGLVPALAIALVTVLAARPSWPVGMHARGYIVVGGTAVAVALALWSLFADVADDADPFPLPYVPLFNPLDIAQAVVLCSLLLWWLRARQMVGAASGQDGAAGSAQGNELMLAALAGLAFLWVNAVALRTIHFWFDVPYTFQALWHSRLAQAVMSLLWTSFALATMLLANRQRWRPAWMVGALLLAAVVLKLFIVDLSQVGGIERIVSFIGVGLLLLLIGYLAPVPPRRMENAS